MQVAYFKYFPQDVSNSSVQGYMVDFWLKSGAEKETN